MLLFKTKVLNKSYRKMWRFVKERRHLRKILNFYYYYYFTNLPANMAKTYGMLLKIIILTFNRLNFTIVSKGTPNYLVKEYNLKNMY